MKRRILFFPALLALFFAESHASAFTEDICYPQGGGPVTDCTPLPAPCEPAGTQTPACLQAAIVTYGVAGSKYPNARSTVHVDVPYVIAQFVGFSATDAYWIAAYSEATDRGSFEPLDENGNVVDPTLETASLTGLERTDFTSGGVLIHFSAPRNPTSASAVSGIDGLHPDPTDATHEIMLANLRDWAMAAANATNPQCAGGLTNASTSGDNATGSVCYANNGSPANISGSVTMFDGPRAEESDADIQTFNVATGFQIIQDTEAGTTTSDQFDAVVGGSATHIADARLGVYIHAFGDRTSHHVCLDQSYTYGPTSGGTEWTADMTNSECAQGLHCLRHIWETGTSYASLAAEDRTTPAYVGNAITELAAFATARGVANANATNTAAQNQLATDLTSALATSGAAARLAAIHQATCSRNLTPFPGEAACPEDDAGASSASDAGSAAPDGSASAGTSSGPSGTSGAQTTANADTAKSGGCAIGNEHDMMGASGLLGFLTLAIWRARRRRASPRAIS